MFIRSLNIFFLKTKCFFFLPYEKHFKFDNVHTSSVFTLDQLLERQCFKLSTMALSLCPYFVLYSFNPVHCDHLSLAVMYSLSNVCHSFKKEHLQCKTIQDC